MTKTWLATLAVVPVLRYSLESTVTVTVIHLCLFRAALLRYAHPPRQGVASAMDAHRLVWLIVTCSESGDTSSPSSGWSLWGAASSVLSAATGVGASDTSDSAPGAELTRIFQRHSLAVAALPPRLKATLCRHLTARALRAGAFVHPFDGEEVLLGALLSMASGGGSSRAGSSDGAARTAEETSAAGSGASSGYHRLAAEVPLLANLLLSSFGVALTEMKRYVDHPMRTVDGGVDLPEPTEYVDMVTVLSLLPPSLRAHVLHHVRVEAAAAVSGTTGGCPGAQSGVPTDALSGGSAGSPSGAPWLWPVKIYSDVDDTVSVRLYDCSFPRGTTYPGYVHFIRALRGQFSSSSSVVARPARASPDAVPAADTVSPTLQPMPEALFATTATTAAEGVPSSPSAAPPLDLAAKFAAPAAVPDGIPELDVRGGGDAPVAVAVDDGGGDTLRPRTGSAPSSPHSDSSPTSRKSRNVVTAALASAASAAWNTHAGMALSAAAALAAEITAAAKKTTASPSTEGARGTVVRRSVSSAGFLGGGASGGAASLSPPAPPARLPALPQRRAGPPRVATARDPETQATSLFPLGDLIFLSARPAFLRPATALLAARIGLDGAAILCGTVAAALTHSRMAGRKLANHLLHASCYPEARVVFIGDSGQADVAFAIRMLAAHKRLAAAVTAGGSAGGPSAVLVPPPPLVIIHDICGLDQVPITPHLQRARLRSLGVHVVDSYIDAAVIAHGAGMLSDDALRAVVDGTTEDLATVVFAADDGSAGAGTGPSGGSGSTTQRVARLQEYQDAVMRAHIALGRLKEVSSRASGASVSEAAAAVTTEPLDDDALEAALREEDALGDTAVDDEGR